MVDLARPLESKASILLPDNLQLKMPRGGPRDRRGCTALDAVCLLFVSSHPGPTSLVLLFAQCWGTQLLRSQGRALWTFALGLLWLKHSWQLTAVQPGLESSSKMLSKVEVYFMR